MHTCFNVRKPNSLFSGYRSVILHNIYGEELELAALLVHVDKQPWQENDTDSNLQGQRLRENELQKV